MMKKRGRAEETMVTMARRKGAGHMMDATSDDTGECSCPTLPVYFLYLAAKCLSKTLVVCCWRVVLHTQPLAVRQASHGRQRRKGLRRYIHLS